MKEITHVRNDAEAMYAWTVLATLGTMCNAHGTGLLTSMHLH